MMFWLYETEEATRLRPLCDTRCEGSFWGYILIWHPVACSIDVIRRPGVTSNGGVAVYNNRFVTNNKHKRWYAVWWGYVWRKDGTSVGSEERKASRDTPWHLGFPSLQGGILLTAWSRVLFEKLTGSQLVKKFPALCGSRRFVTALTRARHLSLILSQISPVHGPPYRIYIYIYIYIYIHTHTHTVVLVSP